MADSSDALNEVTVVDDQDGRLTFTTDMAEAIVHLIDSHVPYGTYNMTGSGVVNSWYQIARTVFDQANGNGEAVKPISTAEYFKHARNPVSPRPVHSALNLGKLTTTGYNPPNWQQSLTQYVAAALRR